MSRNTEESSPDFLIWFVAGAFTSTPLVINFLTLTTYWEHYHFATTIEVKAFATEPLCWPSTQDTAVPGWSKSPTEGQSLHAHLYTTILQSKWEVPYFFPKRRLVFSTEKQHSCSARPGTASAFGKLKASLSQSVTSPPAVLWLSKPSCPRGLLEHPLPTTPTTNHYSVSHQPPLCVKRNVTVPGTWQKTLPKGQNNLTATSSHLLVSGGVLGWLSRAKDLAPKDKNLLLKKQNDF